MNIILRIGQTNPFYADGDGIIERKVVVSHFRSPVCKFAPNSYFHSRLCHSSKIHRPKRCIFVSVLVKISDSVFIKNLFSTSYFILFTSEAITFSEFDIIKGLY